MATYETRTGLFSPQDEVTFPDYGLPSRFHVAELVGDDGVIYAVALEPYERAELGAQAWDREAAFRAALDEWAAEVAPTCEPARPIYLVLDPSRDAQSERLVWQPREEGN